MFSIVAMVVAMDTRKYSFNYIFNISQHKNTKVCVTVLDNSTNLMLGADTRTRVLVAHYLKVKTGDNIETQAF